MVYEGPKFGGTDVGRIWGGNGTETPQIWDAMRNGTPTEMEQKAPQSWNGKADIVFGRILEVHPQRTLRPRERPMKFAKLKERLKTQPRKRTTGKLYQWLFENHAELLEIRLPGEMWLPYIELAIEDGVPIKTDTRSIQRVRKTWHLVCRAKAKRAQALATSDMEKPKNDENNDRPIIPSRLPADWTPEFVEIPQPAPPSVQPVPQSSSLTLKTETVPAGAPMTMEQKIDKARFTLGQAKFDLTLAKEQIRRNDSQGAPMLVKEVEAKLPELREIIKQRRALYDRLLAGEDVPEEELEFKSPREREEDQYSD